MRDPARIRTMLSLLGEYWARHPDLRLGQIVVNLTRKTRLDTFNAHEVFYVEDKEIIKELLRETNLPKTDDD